MTINLSIKGKFVTAKLKDQEDCRQGYVISENPLIIRGATGIEYACEGNPVVVINPPAGREYIKSK